MSKPSVESISPSRLSLRPSEPTRKKSFNTIQTSDHQPQAHTQRPPSPNAAVKGDGTFANQDSLPKLPIPELEQTCQRYLQALAPLQTNREHQETKSAVAEFLKNEGPVLQEKLKQYATGQTSYIEQFCMSFVPLSLRSGSLSKLPGSRINESFVTPVPAHGMLNI